VGAEGRTVMTKVLVLQFLATVVIFGAGAAATVATRVDVTKVDPSPALQAIAVAPVPQLILATRNKVAASKR